MSCARASENGEKCTSLVSYKTIGSLGHSFDHGSLDLYLVSRVTEGS